MKILVNASTLVVGGGIQIGVSFIERFLLNKDLDSLFLISKGIFDNLKTESKNNSKIVTIEKSPAGLISGSKSRKKIKKLEQAFAPDIVYSIGFPSYISFKNIEIGRYTNPWEINEEPLPWHTIPNFTNRFIIKLGIYYRIFWARKADFIETQTENAKIGISKRVKFPLEKIIVIPNSPNMLFIEEGAKILDIEEVYKRNNICFCLSAPYEHKNLDLIPDVAYYLTKKYQIKIQFIITIPENSKIWINIQKKAIRLKVSDLVQNVGPLKLIECIKYYKLSKIVFLPTLLEIFSATYLEAMAMKVPIITTDLDFAHDNCKNAALYFTPSDAKDAAKIINKLINDRSLFINQIIRGENVLNTYPSLDEKYCKLSNFFKKIKNEYTNEKLSNL